MSIQQTLRQDALHQAVTVALGDQRTAEEIVEQAGKFYKFLVADTKEDEEC